MAVYLATDRYDYNNDPNTISVTSLLKPIRSIVLSMTKKIDVDMDISGLIASKVGTAVHDGVEYAWTKNYKNALRRLGYPQKIIDKITINPPEPTKGIDVYLEQRASKKIGKWTISGKFDAICDGHLSDVKTTSCYSYITKSNDTKYIQQGSIYRWLNPDLVTNDNLNIEFLFTDWNQKRAMIEKDKGYPRNKILTYKLPMMSLPDTQIFVERKLQEIEHYLEDPTRELPQCTPEDLWVKESHWKYYKNPLKMTRATKNFDNANEAYSRMAKDGSVGKVIEVRGEPTFCKYCPALTVCTQAEGFILNGSLIL